MNPFDDPHHDREVGQRARPNVATRDTTRIDDTRIDAVRPLITPALLMEKLPGSAATLALVERSREQIARVLHGEDQRLVVVVGPCSIHDHGQALDYARRLKAAAEPGSFSISSAGVMSGRTASMRVSSMRVVSRVATFGRARCPTSRSCRGSSNGFMGRIVAAMMRA